MGGVSTWLRCSGTDPTPAFSCCATCSELGGHAGIGFPPLQGGDSAHSEPASGGRWGGVCGGECAAPGGQELSLTGRSGHSRAVLDELLLSHGTPASQQVALTGAVNQVAGPMGAPPSAV